MPKYAKNIIKSIVSLTVKSKNRSIGGDHDQLMYCLNELAQILKQVDNHARDLLPFVSRIKRDLLLSYHKNSIERSSSTSRPNTPKFVILTAVWQRQELTRLFYEYYAQLTRAYCSDFELSVIVAGSEGECSRQLAESFGFHYLEVPNSPLNNKWQATADYLKDYDFDAAIVVGSDDFLSPSVFLAYRDLFLQGANVIGFVDGHFYNTATDDMLHWHGYGGEKRMLGMPERVGESIGMGRMLSRDVLQQLDYKVWSGKPLDKGLDLRMRQNLADIGFLHVEYEELALGKFKKAIPFSIVTLKSCQKHMLLDVKYQTNGVFQPSCPKNLF